MLKQNIQSDIDERQAVMSQIKLLSPRYGLSEKDEQLFLTYSIPTIYAIWEGFIQKAFRTYIDELNTLSLAIDTICKPILVYHIESQFRQFREYPEKPAGKIAFFDKLGQFYNQNTLEIPAIINTDSNVGFQVLNKILVTFNLQEIPEYPKPRYSLKQELDNFLLRIRNTVAHGQEAVIVSREDLNRAIELVTWLMDEVLDRIIRGFEERSYLHCSDSMSLDSQ